MNAITKANSGAVTAEQVLIRGDLSALGEAERVKYYADVCNSVGLNPLTKPFEYIQLNGKLRLYALKDCTDQLRAIHGVSVTDMTESERDGVFIVTVKVQDKTGRTDIAKGAVNIANLKGEVLANALMKAETKAKRRATLSICGLGLLDETEVDDIPSQQKTQFRVPSPPAEPVKEIVKDEPATPVELTPFKDEKFPQWADRFIASIHTAKNIDEIDQWWTLNTTYLDMINAKAVRTYSKINKAVEIKTASFAPKEDPITTGPQPKGVIGPDIGQDYEGWIKWAFTNVNAARDNDELEAFCAQAIDPHEKDLFPTDYNDLMDAIGKKQTSLTALAQE